MVSIGELGRGSVVMRVAKLHTCNARKNKIKTEGKFKKQEIQLYLMYWCDNNIYKCL